MKKILSIIIGITFMFANSQEGDFGFRYGSLSRTSDDSVGLIGVGSMSAVVWIWNIIDVKKTKSQSYSDHNPASVGINSRGQIEARISF